MIQVNCASRTLHALAHTMRSVENPILTDVFKASVRRMSDFEFTDVSGQTLTKEPGSLNGWDPLYMLCSPLMLRYMQSHYIRFACRESFVLKSLTDCT